MNAPIFKTILGTKQVLLSAPHVYAHKRPRLSMAYKLGEPLTDTVVEEVCKNTDSFGIVMVNESDFDPNYHKEKSNPYKEEVKNIINDNKIRYFIDVHGLKDNQMFDVTIYYLSRFSRSIKLARLIQEKLDKSELKGINIAILRFLDNNQKTLGEYVASRLRVPAVQIEIARYIREKKELRDSFVKNLSDIINEQLI